MSFFFTLFIHLKKILRRLNFMVWYWGNIFFWKAHTSLTHVLNRDNQIKSIILYWSKIYNRFVSSEVHTLLETNLLYNFFLTMIINFLMLWNIYTALCRFYLFIDPNCKKITNIYLTPNIQEDFINITDKKWSSRI